MVKYDFMTIHLVVRAIIKLESCDELCQRRHNSSRVKVTSLNYRLNGVDIHLEEECLVLSNVSRHCLGPGQVSLLLGPGEEGGGGWGVKLCQQDWRLLVTSTVNLTPPPRHVSLLWWSAEGRSALSPHTSWSLLTYFSSCLLFPVFHRLSEIKWLIVQLNYILWYWQGSWPWLFGNKYQSSIRSNIVIFGN